MYSSPLTDVQEGGMGRVSQDHEEGPSLYPHRSIMDMTYCSSGTELSLLLNERMVPYRPNGHRSPHN